MTHGISSEDVGKTPEPVAEAPGRNAVPATAKPSTQAQADQLLTIIANDRTPQIEDLTRLGSFIVAAFFGALILWSVFAPLATGAVVMGQVTVEGNRKVVEHLEGGIIDQILASNGDLVEAGQVLAVMDVREARAQAQDLAVQVFNYNLKRVRLEAQLKGLTPDFTAVARGTVNAVLAADLISGEQDQFFEQTGLYRRQVGALESTVVARQEILEGLNNMTPTMDAQIALLDEEIEGIEELLAKGFASKTRALALKRQRERLYAEKLGHMSQVVTARDELLASEVRLALTQSEYRENLAKELAAVRVDLEGRRAMLSVAVDQVARGDVKSPIAGLVMNARAGYPGEVLEPGSPLFDVVPADAQLIVSGRLQAADGSNIVPGLNARITVQAFKGRNAPQLQGTVLSVSPDALMDDRTGESFYDVKIAFTDDAIDSLAPNQQLQPGFPAQVVIETASQPIIAYLVTPILGTIERAFVEP